MKIIAEVGSNWKTIDDCIKSIHLAKEYGADVVKFQTYTHKELYGTIGHVSCEPNVKLIAMNCSRAEIEFMCTAFSPEGYMTINQYVKRHKIASSEITDLNILRTVNNFKKPVILSTGGASEKEIRLALTALKDCQVTLLYCVVDYPARIIDFRHFTKMQETYGERYQYGYSDHSIDVLNVPLLSMQHGSVILEKHVNFTDHKDTPDAPSSLTAKEFQMMVKHLKGKLPMEETFQPNPHKRVKAFKDYVRPR